MTATQLFAQIEQTGCEVTLDGDKLIVRGPLTDELRQAIRASKAELLALLRKQPDSDIDAQGHEATKLLQERGWVAIKSSVLGEVIIWARDGVVAVPARWNSGVIYTLAELEALTSKKPDKEGLQLLHEAKRAFAGQIIKKEV